MQGIDLNKYEVIKRLWRKFYDLANTSRCAGMFNLHYKLESHLTSRGHDTDFAIVNPDESEVMSSTEGAVVISYPKLAIHFNLPSISIEISPLNQNAEVEGNTSYSVTISLEGNYGGRYRDFGKTDEGLTKYIYGTKMKFSVYEGMNGFIVSHDEEWVNKLKTFMEEEFEVSADYVESNCRGPLERDIHRYINFIKNQFGVLGSDFYLVPGLMGRNNYFTVNIIPDENNVADASENPEAVGHVIEVMKTMGGYYSNYHANKMSLQSGIFLSTGWSQKGLGSNMRFECELDDLKADTKATFIYFIGITARGYEDLIIEDQITTDDISVEKLKVLIDFIQEWNSDSELENLTDPIEVSDEYIEEKLSVFKKLFEDFSGVVINIKRVEK